MVEPSAFAFTQHARSWSRQYTEQQGTERQDTRQQDTQPRGTRGPSSYIRRGLFSCHPWQSGHAPWILRGLSLVVSPRDYARIHLSQRHIVHVSVYSAANSNQSSRFRQPWTSHLMTPVDMLLPEGTTLHGLHPQISTVLEYYHAQAMFASSPSQGAKVPTQTDQRHRRSDAENHWDSGLWIGNFILRSNEPSRSYVMRKQKRKRK